MIRRKVSGAPLRADTKVLGRGTSNVTSRNSRYCAFNLHINGGPMQVRQALLVCKILFWERYTLFGSHLLSLGFSMVVGSQPSEAPITVCTPETSPQCRELRVLPFENNARVLQSPTEIINKGCNTGPRVLLGFESKTSCIVAQCFTNWTNRSMSTALFKCFKSEKNNSILYSKKIFMP